MCWQTAIDCREKAWGSRCRNSIEWAAGRSARPLLVVRRQRARAIAPGPSIKRIFSIFEIKKGSRGNGLGLARSAKKSCDEHGGDIRRSKRARERRVKGQTVSYIELSHPRPRPRFAAPEKNECSIPLAPARPPRAAVGGVRWRRFIGIMGIMATCVWGTACCK